ncbi:MAG: N-acetylmannosamine-6-phosphate 2-epimerase [Drouetiella hepatica Uher 2000/2452]|jgi:N-acylglucosamine-6-phosphate 2-epimerase|uniref:N-acylglucosamine-6-phosphate 2-epimerase n=1 Tax=Drouetiella hepatica Uher 2000/2452 TaxID=904376 RepID=A0A951UKX3_9CYAN|nr:N-acetylmannosamine-6-phosphate 2-epimerase [Drouetiella hepatica Uher 2000/2452]
MAETGSAEESVEESAEGSTEGSTEKFRQRAAQSSYPAIRSLQGGLVVSCQAPSDSPLYEPSVIAAIAQASVHQGAVGVRIDTPAHVEAVRRKVSVPIIGLWKQISQSEVPSEAPRLAASGFAASRFVAPNFGVYITPQFCHAEAIAAAGADIIAIDATLRDRPAGETVESLITQIHQLGKPVMADVDTLEAAIAAAAAGADLVGTTLYGYTYATRSLIPPGFDLLSALVQHLSLPVLCEGGISSPSMARRAIELGADGVVVGTAITGIEAQVKAYRNQLALELDS